MNRQMLPNSARLNVFKGFVQDLANLSKCEQMGVAAIVTDEKLSQVYSVGINGGPKNGPNCLCILPGKYGCLHAEIQALVKCDVPTEGLTMIISMSPCIQCASAIVNAGISKVYYLNEWKDLAGVDLLRDLGVKTFYIEN